MFHVGQKVVCVKDDGQIDEPKSLVKKGSIYTVSRTYVLQGVLPCLEFIELPPPPPFGCYPAKYFRPVVEKKTDISALTALLNQANHKKLEDA